ncbi:MAG: hypothetical protein IKI67_03765 [Bacteroidales bacterium]|nr:hypothetical protein [Bacteroidales bacterium]
MEPRVKIINRNIAKSKNCRCRYNNPKDFDILEININHNGVLYTYKVESQCLSTAKDSIHFYPEIDVNGNLKVRWSGDIEGYIKRVK